MHIYDQILFVSCNNRLKGLDLESGEIVFNLQLPVISWLDGITSDTSGNVYVSTHNSGKVYKFESTLSEPPELISEGYLEPAGLFYNRIDNILAVPDYGGNTVDFIQIPLCLIFQSRARSCI